jgi:hypothetical protein
MTSFCALTAIVCLSPFACWCVLRASCELVRCRFTREPVVAQVVTQAVAIECDALSLAPTTAYACTVAEVVS